MSEVVPDGVFDLVRSICTLTACKIVFDITLKSCADLYIEKCPTCWGCGTMTCPRCHGAKTLMSRPKQLVPVARERKGQTENYQLLLHRAQDATQCTACGPLTRFDEDLCNPDVNDAGETLNIAANLRMAAVGQRVPNVFGAAAGTVVCPGCGGSQVAKRNYPNLRKLFGPEPDIWTQCLQRSGIPVDAGPAQSLKQRRVTRFREYPYLPPFTLAEKRAVILVNPMLCAMIRDHKDKWKKKEFDKIEDKSPLPARYLLPYLDEGEVADVRNATYYP